MAQTIINGAPHVFSEGVEDASEVIVPRDTSAHRIVPLAFILAARGNTKRKYLAGQEALSAYGEDTFNIAKPFYNHSTSQIGPWLNNGGMVAIQRIVPDDAKTAVLMISLKLEAKTIDTYDRDANGQYLLDAMTFLPVVSGTTAGHTYSYEVEDITATGKSYEELLSERSTLGPVTAGAVTTYPMTILKYNGAGAEGNNSGIRLSALSSSTDPSMVNEKSFTYQLEMVQRKSKYAAVTAEKTILGANRSNFTLKPNQIDTLTLASMNFAEVVTNNYSNLTDTRYGITEGLFSNVHFFQTSMDQALEVVATAEKAALTTEAWSDLHMSANTALDIVDAKYMVNIITGRNSDNAPYVTLVADTAAGAISLGEFTNIYANGGDDGDLSLALFEAKVAEAMVKYADEDDAVQNSARFRETTWTDTGFNLDTKIAAISMLAVRHDTGIILGTYEVDASIKAAGPPANWVLGQLQTQEEELAIFTYIRNRLNTVPDSVKYGTSALRAIVIKGSGKLRNTTFQQRVPLTHWIHNKASQLMGSKDGRWKTTDLFDMAPGHIIDNMFDLSEDWVPLSAKQRFWDMGLNYHLTYNDTESMVPILKSVYQSETSIFNNWLTTVATQIIDQSVNRVWRDYVGTISLTGPQLTKAINDAIALDLTGLFGSLYVIKPRAQITDLDLARGYSVDVPVDMYANTMMTVFTTHVRGLRMSELTGN